MSCITDCLKPQGLHKSLSNMEIFKLRKAVLYPSNIVSYRPNFGPMETFVTNKAMNVHQFLSMITRIDNEIHSIPLID